MKRIAFTMAEILLSLTIIGVVAAITLPSLTGNINERTWNTQRKALYARFSQAIALMPALNGYGTLTEDSSAGASDAVDTAAETFVTDGLSKVLKINNICDSDHLSDCGIPEKITDLGGNIIDPIPATLLKYNSFFNGSWTWGSGSNTYSDAHSQLDTKAAAFETQNGESILVYYSPNCVSNMNEMSDYTGQPKMCANFIYDLNGTKGPNTVGKDIGFMSVFYPTDSIVVAPVPLTRAAGSGTYETAISLCSKQDTESRIPNREEMLSMAVNYKLLGTTQSGHYLTSSRAVTKNAGDVWYQSFSTGRVFVYPKNYTANVWCVKR